MQAEAETPAKAVPALATPAAVVVFGRDEAMKPHASQFTSEDAALAEKAAGLMSMRVLRITTAEHATVAARLPAGRIFESGKAFVPYVSVKTFADIEAAAGQAGPGEVIEPSVSSPGEPVGGHLPVGAAKPAGDTPDTAGGPANPLRDWGGIGVGSAVLAAEEGAPNVWYVATVVTQRGPDLFELRWEGDYSDYPLFVRRREHLGLLPLGFKLAAA